MPDRSDVRRTAPFAVDRARSGFFRPFIDPITAYLREAAPSNGNEALRDLLESPRAGAITTPQPAFRRIRTNPKPHSVIGRL